MGPEELQEHIWQTCSCQKKRKKKKLSTCLIVAPTGLRICTQAMFTGCFLLPRQQGDLQGPCQETTGSRKKLKDSTRISTEPMMSPPHISSFSLSLLLKVIPLMLSDGSPTLLGHFPFFSQVQRTHFPIFSPPLSDRPSTNPELVELFLILESEVQR